MESIKPETRARTSTVANATNRPVYSSHSVTLSCKGLDTVTAGNGGAELADLSPQPLKARAANRPTDIGIERVIGCPLFWRDYRRFQIFAEVPPARGHRCGN